MDNNTDAEQQLEVVLGLADGSQDIIERNHDQNMDEIENELNIMQSSQVKENNELNDRDFNDEEGGV